MSSSSMPRRPAVSTMTTSYCFWRASSTPPRARSDGRAGVRRVDGHARALADHLQLGDGAGTLQVARHQQWLMALPLQQFRQLARERGLTGTLQTGQHDHRRRVLGQVQPPGLAAEDADEFLVDDLHDLLGRVQRRADLRALGALLDPSDEAADDGQRDVSLQQREADLAAGGVDVGR
jgi:hypothetical protein